MQLVTGRAGENLSAPSTCSGSRGVSPIAPRRNEVAKKAVVFVQTKQGTDPIALAGIIRVILAEQLYDNAFVKQHTSGYTLSLLLASSLVWGYHSFFKTKTV